MRASGLAVPALLLALAAPAHARLAPVAPAHARLALPALRAAPDRRGGGRIVDSAGREVTLRGVNVNALAEYWRGTRFPTVFPLQRRDPGRMEAVGWSAVRLLVSWSRVEPRPGSYDERYLDRIRRTAARLTARGLYVFVDLHQDAWGPGLAARPGEVCPAGSQPAIGWDGAPAWATLVPANVARCAPNGTRELSAAVLRAWSEFFADARGPGGVGIQTRYVRMLGHIARRLGRAHGIAGFDVMNEPNAFGADESAALSRMYSRALRAIRAAERRARSRRHLVLFEPSALWSAIGHGAPADFRRDRDVVYAPHIYTGAFSDGPITEGAFATAVGEARDFGGAPVLSGEWGADPGRAQDPGDPYFVAHQDLQDRFHVGATLWTWRESCGDPHKAVDLRAGRIPEVWGEWDVDCRTNRVVGPRRALLAELARGYVRAAPGRLAEQRWDHASRRLLASGARAQAGTLLAAFYPARPRIRTRGLRRVRVLRTAGKGRLVLARARGGHWSLRLGPR